MRVTGFYREPQRESLTELQRFWRDFGVHPGAMAARAFVDRKPEGGSALAGGVAGAACVARQLETDLHEVFDTVRDVGLGEDGLRNFQKHLGQVAQSYGVEIDYGKGAPIVNWGVFPTLEVKDWGGTSAGHEMVHAVQCTIGGAMALGTYAALKTGAQTFAQVQESVRGLSAAERKEAYQRFVVPMETQAYAHFEETAFEVGGMFGKRQSGYADRLERVGRAFVRGYETATVPEISCGLDARVYGTIGHVARTHGETAVVLGGAAVAYGALARSALRASPLLGAGALVPLGYLIYRTLAG